MKQPDLTNLNAMAMEACDMWQEHLSALANDPSARAELTKFLEPQRRLFADWAAMMQQGGSHGPSREREEPTAKTNAAPEPSASPAEPAPQASPTPAGGPAFSDDPLRVAQLALRLAELEKRVMLLEARAAGAAR